MEIVQPINVTALELPCAQIPWPWAATVSWKIEFVAKSLPPSTTAAQQLTHRSIVQSSSSTTEDPSTDTPRLIDLEMEQPTRRTRPPRKDATQASRVFEMEHLSAMMVESLP